MAYTVKRLAELSGVTIRTLRWYDKVGVLKPTYYGENGYRHYEEEELLTLQQILFFRELGFKLGEIKGILDSGDFDKVKALLAHRRTLKESLVRTKELIKTIDKTVLHLRGKQMMEDKEIYKGFHKWAEGKGSESYFIGFCEDPNACETAAERVVLKSVKFRNNKNVDASHFEQVEATAHAIYGKLIACMERGLEPSSDEVQAIIAEHHLFVQEFHEATREVYRALAELYRVHSAYRNQLDPVHPELASYMAAAMDTFAASKLS